MKNKILALLLAVSMGALKAQNDDAAQLAVALAKVGVEGYIANQEYQASLPSEKNYRRQLYWLLKNDPLFYKRGDFKKDFEYSVAIIKNHIEVLQNKIASNQNGLKSNGMYAGIATSALSTLSGVAVYYFLNERKAIQAGGESLLATKRKSEETLDMMMFSVSFGLVSVATAALAAQKFYKVYRYQARLIERLERDKQLLVILEEEKAGLDKDKKENDVAAHP